MLLSDLPPLVELIERSGGGRTVARDADALADALVDLLGDEPERRRLGRAGREFWRAGHTPDAVARCHERIYDTVLAGSRGSPMSERRELRSALVLGGAGFFGRWVIQALLR